MFENVGGKIKSVAKFFFYIELIAAVIVSVIVGVAVGDEVNFFVGLLAFLATMLGTGVGIALITAWFLYGFGEVVEYAEKRNKGVISTEREVSKTSQTESVRESKIKQYVCDNCGKISSIKGNCSICGYATREK